MAFIVPQGPDLGQLLGQGAGAFLEDLSKNLAQRTQNENLQKQLIKAGLPPELASLYSQTTEGGKTAIIQKGLEESERRQGIPFAFEEEEGFKIPSDQGLTAKEKAKREESRYPLNIKSLEEAEQKLNSLEKESMSLNRLKSLNETGKLPKGFARINVNRKTGQLLVPFLASPEAELFVKTVNDFTTKAKDSFGARVTNFELDRFMQRLPTLANSEEGRSLILEQMNLINEMDKSYENALLEAFEKAGGSRKIDLDQARNYARKISKKNNKKLIEKFNNLNKKSSSLTKKGTDSTDQLPSAKKGQKLSDLSEEEQKAIFERAGRDVQKAYKLAEKLGYER